MATILRGAFPELPSRHLGLVTADARNVPEQVLTALAEALERYGRVDEILKIARSATGVSKIPVPGEKLDNPRRLRLGLAYDAAFHFYYRDNLEALEAHGCEMTPFSPLQDNDLPEGLDGLYFGGGYPEEYAEALAENTPMLESIRRFAGESKPVYAECGGLMYLAQGIECRNTKRHGLVGLLPHWTRMLDRRKALSYVEVTLTRIRFLESRVRRFGGTNSTILS